MNINLTDNKKISVLGAVNFFNDRAETSTYINLTGKDFSDIYGIFVYNKLKKSGSVNGGFNISGRLDKLNVTGEAVIDNFNFEEYKAKQARIKLYIKDDIWTVTNLVFDQDGKGLLKASGSMELTGKSKLNVDLSGENLEISSLPVVNALLKNISGRVSLNTKITGNLETPKFEASANSSKLILNSQPVSKFLTAFSFENGLLNSASLNINDQYYFLGNIKLYPEKNIDAEIQVKNGDLATLFDFFKIKHAQGEVKGSVFSRIKLSGSFNDLSGYGALNLKNAEVFGNKIDICATNFLIKNGDFKINKFDLTADNGEISDFGGVLSLREEGGSNLKFKLSSKVLKKKFEGSFTVSGILNTKSDSLLGKVRTSELTFDGEKFAPVLADIKYIKENQELAFEFFDWEKIKGKVLVDLGKGTSVSVLSFNGADAAKTGVFERILSEKKPKGKIYGDLRVETVPEGLKAKTSNLRIMDFGFDSIKNKSLFLDAEFQSGKRNLLSVRELRLSQQEGNIRVSGKVNFDENYKLENSDSDLTVSLSGAEAKELLEIFGKKTNIEGKITSMPGIKINGKLSSPDVYGEAKIENIKIGELVLGTLWPLAFNYSKNKLEFSKLVFSDRFNNKLDFQKASIVLNNDSLDAELSCAANFNYILGLKANAGIVYKGRVLLGDNPVIEGKVALSEFFMNGYPITGKDSKMLFSFKNEKDELKLTEDPKSVTSLLGKVILAKDSVKFEKVKIKFSPESYIELNGISSKDSDLNIDTRKIDTQLVFRYFDLDFDLSHYTKRRCEAAEGYRQGLYRKREGF